MNRVATLFGYMFLACWLIGTFAPGMSFHVELGPTSKVKQWHAEHAGELCTKRSPNDN